MINGRIIHPPLLAALAAAGHCSTILVADAHYSVATAVGPRATIVHLNLTVGTPLVTDVIELLAEAIPIERRTTMRMPPGTHSEVQEAISRTLGSEIEHVEVERDDFYALARREDLALCRAGGRRDEGSPTSCSQSALITPGYRPKVGQCNGSAVRKLHT